MSNAIDNTGQVSAANGVYSYEQFYKMSDDEFMFKYPSVGISYRVNFISLQQYTDLLQRYSNLTNKKLAERAAAGYSATVLVAPGDDVPNSIKAKSNANIFGYVLLGVGGIILFALMSD
jgi:hypothetical protein